MERTWVIETWMEKSTPPLVFIALTNAVAFERSPKESERVSEPCGYAGKSIPGRGNDIWPSLSNLWITNFTCLQMTWIL